ncbi:MAG: tRNA preQ1(34) S-adenosylmethionine ribosyltransferase-isomerase QueA [Clostridia bacterium]|nr:tRNA preQ1(34) S-adenosylmethionine ribosyltransferase-isomerase QueA [Clostridia bacterium]
MYDTDLSVKDFDYDLPKELIAQTPLSERDSSRLMCIGRTSGAIEHKIFRDIVDMLEAGDVLVINDSKVIPARLYGKKEGTNVDCEFVLLHQDALDEWETMVRPGRRLRPGTAVIFNDGVLRADILETADDGLRRVHFSYDKEKYKNIFEVLDVIGNMPLPPYITERLADKDRYQTVYAREKGSAAAPTAGLHFTPELLEKIRQKGVKIAPVMLHVGIGTFRPVKVEKLRDHVMHSEYFSVTKESADMINSARKNGGRIVAVGTTCTRVLESASDEQGIVHPMCKNTDIFIFPGYKFKAVDCLITNFHLPQSTLIMLVSAFSSKEIVMNAYAEAIKEKYRFFSFGDACFFH